jgi:hypothetical protein
MTRSDFGLNPPKTTGQCTSDKIYSDRFRARFVSRWSLRTLLRRQRCLAFVHEVHEYRHATVVRGE